MNFYHIVLQHHDLVVPHRESTDSHPAGLPRGFNTKCHTLAFTLINTFSRLRLRTVML
ncbi:hypothetical protein J6590_021750 [Homalodisca vitripennis]|nr:hypothetical protein J6590_021750 [Homalodisca vitripennis]